MFNKIKKHKIWSGFLILIALLMLSNFIYTRVYLNKYEFTTDGGLFYKDNVYVTSYAVYDDTNNIGKLIGTVKERNNTQIDWVFPTYVRELKDDKYHNKIIIRGLMDSWTVYERQKK